ncbi:ComF family protein [Patescibacteria group bacterium]|nr:ComF family protein [Patescibacteria group bacterium]
MSQTKKILQIIIELIFPSSCFGCGIEGVWLCKDCSEQIPLYPKDVCLWCGKHIKDNKMCLPCQNESQLDSLFALTAYQNPLLKNMLHNLKYNFASNITDAFALLLNLFFDEQKTFTVNKNCILVPIPLHKKRFAERGFNQSELIGDRISQILQIQTNSGLLARIRNTKSQMTLNKKERLLNMKNSFVCPDPYQIKNKEIILVDDVLTTGATIKEASLALKKAGCRSVSAFVLAKEGLINSDKNGRIN